MTTQAVHGQVLTGSVGLWVNFPTGYNFQLLRNGNIFATGPWDGGVSYTVQLSDVGTTISLVVIASNGSGSGPPANSASVLIVS